MNEETEHTADHTAYCTGNSLSREQIHQINDQQFKETDKGYNQSKLSDGAVLPKKSNENEANRQQQANNADKERLLQECV